LSKNTGIPKNYLSKVLLVLGNAGIIEASRGSGGGYRLSAPPDTIPLVRVVELFDRHVAKRGCLLGLRPACTDEDPCAAHHAWKFARSAYFDFLESTSLRDISAANGKPLAAKRSRKR
jgi:Rrf2 family protein